MSMRTLSSALSLIWIRGERFRDFYWRLKFSVVLWAEHWAGHVFLTIDKHPIWGLDYTETISHTNCTWFRCGRLGQCAVYLLSTRFQILTCVWFMAARIAKSTKETGAQTRPYLLACLDVVAFFDIWTGQLYTSDVAVLFFWTRNWPPRLNKCASVRSLLSSNSCQERTWLKDIMLTSNGCWDHLLRA